MVKVNEQLITKENDLLENGTVREKYLENVEVLDKVKILVTIPKTQKFSIDIVSNYFDVGIECIKSLIKDNKKELTNNGLIVLKGSQLKSFKNLSGIKSRAKALTILNKKTVLNIAMLLTESEVAEKVRKQLLKDNPDLYYKLSKGQQLRFKKYETEIKNYLEFSFGKENVQYQVKFGRYKLDFLLFNKIHIEVDEYGHKNYNFLKEKERKIFILKNSTYKTIRYNPQKEKPYILIQKILEELENN